jgi:hypothetical protein
VVGGVGANVVNVFALGNLPDSVTKDWLSYGFAGLNPFMNVQSNGRAQQNLAGIDEVQRDKRTEYSSLPWSERPVQVKAGKQTFDMTTDRNGVLRLNLLDSPFAEHDLNHVGKLQISVEDSKDDVHSDSSLMISSHLAWQVAGSARADLRRSGRRRSEPVGTPGQTSVGAGSGRRSQ